MPKPNFLGLGAAKAGTTKMAQLLSQHPQIFMSEPKELHFFDGDGSLGDGSLDSYLANFKENIAIGEYTPSYLFVPDAPEAMAKLLGTNLKFIVALRNPIDRAYSHYCHAVNNWSARIWQARGYPVETGTFSEALIEEPARLTSGEYHIRHQSYFSKGLYALQLRRFFAHFPRENFFVYLFEDFVAEPRLILAELCAFLAVDHEFKFDDPETKVNAQTLNQLDPALRHQLQLAYQPANAELEKLIGRDLKLWNC